MSACMCAQSLQSCPTPFNPMNCSPPSFSVHRILQARILEWVGMPSSKDLPNPGIELTSLMSPVLAGGFFTTSTTWEAPKVSSSTRVQKHQFFSAKPSSWSNSHICT